MSLCDKENPCLTCKWYYNNNKVTLRNCLVPPQNYESAFSQGTFGETSKLFGCWAWELREDLLEIQIGINNGSIDKNSVRIGEEIPARLWKNWE